MIKINFPYRSYIIACFLLSTLCYSQADFPLTSSFLQLVNPSIHGMNLTSKAGVQFSNFNYGDGLNAERNYLYGNIAFNDLNFSLGIDVKSLTLNQLGLRDNSFRLSYAYNLRLGFTTYFLAGVDIAINSQILDPNALIFQDQLNAQLGSIVGSSIDPLAKIKPSTNYFDMGISATLYNEKYMLGIHIAHLNTPNISFNKESTIEKEISYTLNGAVEFDVNPYGRGILPENTFFYGSIYGVLHANTMRIVASQELQMNTFSIGVLQSLVSYGEKSAFEKGIITTIAFNNFLLNVNYTLPSASNEINVPAIFELGLRFNFDKFLNNRRGYFKRLNTDNL